LNLIDSYEKLTLGFSKNARRNIDKASKLNLRIFSDITADVFLTFYFSIEKHFLSPKQPVLEKLLKRGISEKALTLYGVYSEKDELIAGLCILHTSGRITYLLPVSNSEGKNSSAMFLLIDSILQKEAGKEKILDFEGSRIEGVARLYRGFGAKFHPYYILKRFRPSFFIGKLPK